MKGADIMLYQARITGGKYLLEVEKLYKMHFIEAERIPFEEMINNENITLEGFFEGDELVSYMFLISLKRVLSILYFATKDKFRNRGFGKEILNSILLKYQNYLIILDIEEEDGDEIKTRRKNFYLRNGFISSGVFYIYGNVNYEILTYNGLPKEEILNKIWKEIYTGNPKIIR